MVDLPRAVQALVDAATSEVEPRALRGIVEKVLDAFEEESSEGTRDAALRSIGRALPKVDGRGAQILSLALGALVEGGASPELAWPAVSQDLRGLLGRATAFATALVKESKKEHVEEAIAASGAVVAKKKPREAEAWKALPSRSLAAVACLTRSKKIRLKAGKDASLLEAAWPLSDVVSEVGYLLQALRILDDTVLLVLAPGAGRGWRVRIDAMPSNAELYILLGDALIGDPKKGRLPGKRPDPKAVLAIKEGSPPKKSASSVTLPFHLVAWTALNEDGSLSPANADETDHWVWMEGVPADIPAFGKERIVLLQEPPYARPTPVAPSFEALRPELRIVAELAAADVERTLLKLGKAAAKLRPAKAKTRTETKKKTAAKAAPKKKTKKA
jgi:hypothetical protein